MTGADVLYIVDRLGWTLGGVLVGIVLGYVLRGVQEARRASERAEAAAHEAVDATHHLEERLDERDGGAAEVRAAVVLLVIAVLVTAGGVVTSLQAQSRASCLTQYNAAFRAAYVARVDAADETTAAADRDRAALDAAIVAILAAPTSAEVETALEVYLDARAESDAQRAAAQQVREENPYPLPPECR